MKRELKEFLARLEQTNPELAEALRPRQPGPPDPELCVHEAGHAVLMHVAGRKIESARADEYEGAVQPCREQEWRLNCLHQIAVLVAGDMAAQRNDLWSATQWRQAITVYLSGGRLGLTSDAAIEAQSDERVAVLFAVAAGGNDMDLACEYARQGVAIATELLARHDVQAAVQALADELLVRGTVPGSEVHALINQHLPFGFFRDKWPCPTWANTGNSDNG